MLTLIRLYETVVKVLWIRVYETRQYLKSKPDREKVFDEVFRVLKPGGQFLIWDLSVPQRPVGEKRNYLILLLVAVKDRVVETGYGQPWPNEEHDLAFYQDLAKKSGFQVMEQQEVGQTFFLQLQKP
ncbi:class I SAM-dependent methyltransferase [Chloroflexota bacterium]